MTRNPIPFLLILAFAVACAGETETESGTEAEGSAAMAEGPPPVTGDTATTASGLQYIVIERGEGEQPEAGQVVRVHYTG